MIETFRIPIVKIFKIKYTKFNYDIINYFKCLMSKFEDIYVNMYPVDLLLEVKAL